MVAAVAPSIAPTLSISPLVRCWTVIVCLLLWNVAALYADGNAYGPELLAYRLPPDTPVALDGRLDEPFWEEATPIDQFTQQEPREGGTPTERTVVRVAYDENYLYIGAVMYDSQPDRITAHQRRRDASLDTDDRFRWILDTFGDGRTAYYFETNPAGLRGDGVVSVGQSTTLDRDWNGIWDVRTHRGSHGWSAEIRIPFRTLNFDPDLTAWGINFQRTIRRSNEEVLWTSHRRSDGLLRLPEAGRLSGLSGMTQGVGLEVVPYVTGRADNAWQQPDGNLSTSTQGDAGFDLNYSITSNLRSAVSINTDFAETEVDDRRVNLTRFPLRFPEKRQFFLEGSNIFSFAPASGVTPYFSRNIGLVQTELGATDVPIRGAARLTGQVDRFDVGFVHARTGSADVTTLEDQTVTTPAEDFTVGRVRANILSESTIGAIYTRRASHGDDPTLQDRHTFGTDLELGTSSFRGSNRLLFQAFFVGHNRPRTDGTSDFFDRTARGIRVNFPNRPWYGHMSYREFGSSFAPALGFTSRNGFRRLQPSTGYSLLFPDSGWLRELDLGLRYERLMDLDFERLNEGLTFAPTLRFESGDRVSASINRSFERLRFGFNIIQDVPIEPGAYTAWRGSASFRSASYRRVAGGATLERRDFWTGYRNSIALDLTVRPFPGVNITSRWDHQQVRLAQGGFDVHLVRGEADIDLTPRIAFANQLQYDNLSGLVGLFSRLRWTIQPGSDLFVVYTHNWQDLTGGLQSLESQFTTKLTYTHRF